MSYDASLGGGGWVVGDIKPAVEGPVTFPAGAGGYPSGAVPVTNTATGAAASVVATLPAAASKTTYLTSLAVTGSGATAETISGVGVAGVSGGTMTFVVGVPAGATKAIAPLIINFNPPIPASAVNTAITVTASTFGGGNLAVYVVATGFQL